MPLRGRQLARRAWNSRVFAHLMAAIGPVFVVVGNTSAWAYRVAYARQQLGHHDAASRYYERAVKAHPRPPMPWQIRLADLWRTMGREDAAVQLLLAATDDVHDGELAHVHLLATLDGTDLWDLAVAKYRTAATASDDRVAARRLLETAISHPTMSPQDARDACMWATGVQPPDGEVLLRCARLKLQHGDVDGALDALNSIRSVDAMSESVLLDLRVEVADTLWKNSRFTEACHLLRQTTSDRPDHAPTFEKLGQIALDAIDWHKLEALGHHAKRPSSPSSPRRQREQPTDFLALACWALEHAARLGGSRRTSVHAALGRARERRGYWEGAAATYDALTATARQSTRRWVVRNLHRWEFRQERAYHRMGVRRVFDPIFSCSVDPVADGDELRPDAGLFRLSFTPMGAHLQGRLFQPCDVVRVAVDGHVLRTERVGGAGTFPGFALALRRGTLDAFPQTCTLTVTTGDGRHLGVTEGGTGYRVRIPHGDGSLMSLLEAGRRLDKKGRIAPTLEDISKRQDKYLDLYDRVRHFFDDVLSTQCFVLYGTLLGLHRDGDFIPSDDDFDCGYISDCTNPTDVKAEMREIIGHLLGAGFVISFNRRGRLFRITDPEHILDGIHLDTRPAWFEGGKLWMHNHVRYPSTRNEWLPADEREFRHVTVYVPKDVERFLEAHYGPGWRTPDPSFTYYSDEMDPTIHQHLVKTLIAPAEYRQWKRDFATTLGPSKAANFISIAEQPLYPLTGLLD